MLDLESEHLKKAYKCQNFDEENLECKALEVNCKEIFAIKKGGRSEKPKCKENHELKEYFTPCIKEIEHKGPWAYCRICRSHIEITEKEKDPKGFLHCDTCKYDVCHNCWNKSDHILEEAVKELNNQNVSE